MNEKILFVDDEIDVLRGLKRNLTGKYNVEIALGPLDGIKALDEKGPFSIVVSDYRMPEMDGAKFLEIVREKAPDTVRMMLTGFADLNAAIDIVNKGHIYRFLTKPCSPQDLESALNAGLKQYMLVQAERELLQDTLKGSIQLLTELLSLLNPIAFSKSLRIKGYVKKIVEVMMLHEPWQYEIAAMLSQIGCVMISSEILEKEFDNNGTLTRNEIHVINNHPAAGQKFLEKIPRLETIAAMIGRQNQNYVNRQSPDNVSSVENAIIMGGDILKVALDFYQLINNGHSTKSALAKLGHKFSNCNPAVVNALVAVASRSNNSSVKSIYLNDLKIGMVLHDHVRTQDTRTLLATKGQEVHQMMIQRLVSYDRSVGVEQPFYVIDEASCLAG